ncbi:MAG TPA: signal peptidase II [Epulopiscium sp.]|nr:signal peptidase II [Candidatus Epulonipiscium sp.]
MYIIFILGILTLVFLDQLTKWLVVLKLKPIHDFPIIDQVFHLTYVENRGAAFGILQGKHLFFIIMTLIVMICIAIYYYKLPQERKYNWMRFSLILLGSGAIGNLIDRIRLGYVIDFLYFKLIDFPVFNFADICVVVGVSILSIFVLINPDDNKIKGSL